MTRREFEQKLTLLWCSRLEPGSLTQPQVHQVVRAAWAAAKMVEDVEPEIFDAAKKAPKVAK